MGVFSLTVSNETEGLYRVYRHEWVVVHFLMQDPDNPTPLVDQVREYFQQRYEGRVRPEDMRIECSGRDINEVCQLQLKLPNMRGEFKHRIDALRWVKEQGWDEYRVVLAGTQVDEQLRQYGIRKLPAS